MPSVLRNLIIMDRQIALLHVPIIPLCIFVKLLTVYLLMLSFICIVTVLLLFFSLSAVPSGIVFRNCMLCRLQKSVFMCAPFFHLCSFIRSDLDNVSIFRTLFSFLIWPKYFYCLVFHNTFFFPPMRKKSPIPAIPLLHLYFLS